MFKCVCVAKKCVPLPRSLLYFISIYSRGRHIMFRGLYEQDKLSFKLILALKILLTAQRLDQSDVTLFIKGGAALDLNAVRPKPYLWLADPAWLNAIQLSRENVLFKVMPRQCSKGIRKTWNRHQEHPTRSYTFVLSTTVTKFGVCVTCELRVSC